MNSTELASSHSVDTEVGEEDIYRYVVHQLWHDRVSRVRLLLALVVAAGGTAWTLSGATPLPVALMAGAAVGASAPWLYRLHLRWTVRHQMRSAPGFQGPGRISISPEGVFEESAASLVALRWTTFQRVEGTPEQILFYHGRDAALIVPRRSFPNAEAGEQFLRDARLWHAEAHGREPQ